MSNNSTSGTSSNSSGFLYRPSQITEMSSFREACLAPCCQSAPPDERERARKFNETMRNSSLQCPPNASREELAAFMEAKGKEVSELFFESEGMESELAATRDCFLPSCKKPGAHRCSRCKAVYYCSRECAQKNWTRHRPDCKEPPKWDPTKIFC